MTSKDKRVIQPITPGLKIEQRPVPNPPKDSADQQATPSDTPQDISPAHPSTAPHRLNLANIYPEPFHNQPDKNPSRFTERQEPRYDDAANGNGFIQALVIGLLAAGAGALYHYWFQAITDRLPLHWLACQQNHLETIASPGTVASTWFASLSLFVTISVLCYLLLRKSYALVFCISSFFVGLFFFLELALLPNEPRYSWLYHSILWNFWLIPICLAILGAIVSFVFLRHRSPRFITITAWCSAVLGVLAIFLLPIVVNYLLLQPEPAFSHTGL